MKPIYEFMKKGSDSKEFLQKVPYAIADTGFTLEFRARLRNAMIFSEVDGWKDKELLFRLEYSKKQNHFHCNLFTHKPNTSGYITLHEALEDSKCKNFISYMQKKYEKNVFIPIQALRKEIVNYA